MQNMLQNKAQVETVNDTNVTKKLSYFVSNKDKFPPLSRSNLVYEVACPGCVKTYQQRQIYSFISQ